MHQPLFKEQKEENVDQPKEAVKEVKTDRS